tara:strand:+ start:306 stop:437 length:132 start_codon:yes stop_codon:yes gene_type:complete
MPEDNIKGNFVFAYFFIKGVLLKSSDPTLIAGTPTFKSIFKSE